MRLTLGQLVDATGGRLLAGDPAATVESYSIDTRALRAGGAFFALPGTRTDGHAFLGEARRAGAVLAVVSREPAAGHETPPGLLLVEDVVAALGACGALARATTSARVVAVTGSTGKTTTKELIAAALGTTRRIHRTSGNLNNHLGVPLTLLACPESADVQVIEMGMSAAGEIAALATLARPDVALVTNVRPVHMQFFRSLDDVAAAKGELFAVLRPDAVAVVNQDDPHVRLQAARHAGPRVTFGSDPAADVVLEDMQVRFEPGTSVRIRHAGCSHEVRLRLGGAHAGWNAVAALATALAAGGTIEESIPGMERLEPGAGRGRVHHLTGGVVVVDDAYNSNPAAVAAVLDTLAVARPEGRKVAVIGDMLELGTEEVGFHREIGRQAARAGVDLLVGVGPLAREAIEEGARAGVHGTLHEPDAAAAARSLPARIRPGDLVVVKGSRGVRLEKVVQALLSAHAPEKGA